MITEIRKKHSRKEYIMFTEAWSFMALSRILIHCDGRDNEIFTVVTRFLV
ncbi:MAG: hypothetical protein M0R23_05065 [Bacteroidales bacterium]|nr:hypothetical protein [Bacteroidales bacterium]